MKIIISIIPIIFSLPIHCGINKTTVHSRANCMNNESITWWLGHSFNWRVVSIHQHHKDGPYHVIDTGYNTTWRQAAVCWGEAGFKDKWIVTGFHYLKGWGNGRYFDKTDATDCNIYTGWWDY